MSPTLKANYSQMACRNFLFTKNDGFSAPAIMLEYAKKKNVRLELMYKRGFRPSHALWVDTYNKQFGGGIIYTILAGVSSRNHYYVAVEL